MPLNVTTIIGSSVHVNCVADVLRDARYMHLKYCRTCLCDDHYLNLGTCLTTPYLQVLMCPFSRVMAVLGADDLRTSEEFYIIIEETLACAECNSNIGQGE